MNNTNKKLNKFNINMIKLLINKINSCKINKL